uniref:cellulose 1,4-beta-cellobiosidase (non-reducing end) n=1 Tax=Limnoria quadripunctata TaxID=161573 RepID=D4HRL1_LIMQU|nr:GH7 family protein [Limnoria quadripunctata]
MRLALTFLLCFLAVCHGQQAGNETEEYHSPLTWENDGSIVSGSVVIDANWRWIHSASYSENQTSCYDGVMWDTDLCPDADTCTENCAVEGIAQEEWDSIYGITASGSQLTLTYVTAGYSYIVGARVFLMADDDNYQIFNLLDKEFSFDVDTSNLPCGLNGALYFVAMDEDGGSSNYSTNTAGAKYGIGYCNAQCPHDVKFIAGKTNSEGWVGFETFDTYAIGGNLGACCPEIDIWDANSMAQTYTAHVCSVDGYTPCTGIDCGDDDDRHNGVCDKDGCDFASYRVGQTDFYGSGLTIDSNSTITVITQFITDDSGELSEIRRIYQQNGQTIQNAPVNFPGDVDEYDSITEDYCVDIKRYFGDTNDFDEKGGMSAMSDALSKGMVLAMSLLDDPYANMLWLDSTYPVDSTAPGALRGPCDTSSGDPDEIQSEFPNSTVTFSNIKLGPIQSYDINYDY